ncbi:MAG: Adenylate cyclase 2 [Syntrophorhabdus sp. PtaU1.Bin058]|nr:MAG: Adenylate cyclase 2 [Syntrophorhabdus sp. PtaU1.Bin058]
MLIDSKEIIQKTGISRATLNNYIRLGIIPKPLVKRPDRTHGKTKKIGFFPQSVFDSINRVKTMKKEGMSIQEIAAIFAGEPGTHMEKMPGEIKREPEHITETRTIPRDVGQLTLSIDDIRTPAYLINYKFEIEWTNQTAEEEIFRHAVRQINDPGSRNIFRFLFYNETIFDLHMTYFKSRHSKEAIPRLYMNMEEKEIDFFNRSFDRSMELTKKELINQTYVDITKKDGSRESYRLYVTFFREGLFFLYERADTALDGAMEFLTNRSRVISDLLQRRMPVLINFCVIVADLQDSVRICAELPPEEYFELINQMRRKIEESFRKYYGVYGKHAGDGLVYYFLKDRDLRYITNSVDCALEIKGRMEKLSEEWRMRKKWDNGLYLNIGLNEGQEYFSALHPSANIEFTALGDTINYASRLSDLARNGAVFTTKNLVNRMDKEDRCRFIFGIRKKTSGGEVFVENTFSRVTDLLDVEDRRNTKIMDISALSVTEILGKASDHGWC